MSVATKHPEIILHTLGGAFGMRSVSPFCLKLEMLLAHLQLDYDLVVDPDPRKAPKGKMPWAKIDGEVFADSEIITARLDELAGGIVTGNLDPRERAHGLALTRLAEEHLYWIMVASRWLDDEWWPNVVRDFFHIVPRPARALVAGSVRRRMEKTYRLQGLGSHSLEEQRDFARRDLQALQDAVSEKGFLLRSEPTLFDFAVAAIMAGIYDNQPGTWLTEMASEYSALRDFTDRVQQKVGVFGRQLEV